jgi:hypothetical protein
VKSMTTRLGRHIRVMLRPALTPIASFENSKRPEVKTSLV